MAFSLTTQQLQTLLCLIFQPQSIRLPPSFWCRAQATYTGNICTWLSIGLNASPDLVLLLFFFWWDELLTDYTRMVCNMMPCQRLECGVFHGLCNFIFWAVPPPSPPHCQTSNILRSALLWVITQQIAVIPYWLFGTTNRSQNSGNELPLYAA